MKNSMRALLAGLLVLVLGFGFCQPVLAQDEEQPAAAAEPAASPASEPPAAEPAAPEPPSGESASEPPANEPASEPAPAPEATGSNPAPEETASAPADSAPTAQPAAAGSSDEPALDTPKQESDRSPDQLDSLEGGEGTGDPSTASSGDRPADATEAPAKTPAPLTQEQAHDLFRRMGNRSAKEGFTPDEFNDGCYYRAHIYEKEAVADGLTPQRIHAVAGKQLLEGGKNDDGLNVQWGYHTAVVLPVLGDDGKPHDMVFDPAGHDRPVPVDTWAGRIIPGGKWDTGNFKDAPGERDQAFVSIAPGSTSQASNIVPPFGKMADDPKSIETAKGWAKDHYDDVYPVGPDGKPNPNRSTWRKDPGPLRLTPPPS